MCSNLMTNLLKCHANYGIFYYKIIVTLFFFSLHLSFYCKNQCEDNVQPTNIIGKYLKGNISLLGVNGNLISVALNREVVQVNLNGPLMGLNIGNGFFLYDAICKY